MTHKPSTANFINVNEKNMGKDSVNVSPGNDQNSSSSHIIASMLSLQTDDFRLNLH